MRAIRLLGKQPLDAIGDDEVMSIYLACQAMDPEGPDVFAEPLGDLHRPEMEAQRRAAGGAVRGGAGRAVAAGRGGRPGGAAGDRGGGDGAGRGAAGGARRRRRRPIGRTSRRGCPTPASGRVEWLHKHQVTCSRTLFRTFEELRKVRRDFAADPSGDEGSRSADGFPPCDEDHGQDGRATEESEVARASSLWLVAEPVTLAADVLGAGRGRGGDRSRRPERDERTQHPRRAPSTHHGPGTTDHGRNERSHHPDRVGPRPY